MDVDATLGGSSYTTAVDSVPCTVVVANSNLIDASGISVDYDRAIDFIYNTIVELSIGYIYDDEV